MFNRLPLGAKIIAGRLAPMILVIVLCLISLWAINTLNTTSFWVEHTQDVILHADGILSGLVNCETG